MSKKGSDERLKDYRMIPGNVFANEHEVYYYLIMQSTF